MHLETLNEAFILAARRRIESRIVPLLESIYPSGRTTLPGSFRPHLKYTERVVSFYDYYACGLSVAAHLAAEGDVRSLGIINQLLRNMEHYRTRVYGRVFPGLTVPWQIPLRRLLFHAALAYEILEKHLKPSQRKAFRKLLEQQTRAAIDHSHRFFPGEQNLHLGFANNHSAIFMQGVYHAGRVLGRSDWMHSALDAAARLFRSGHPDGYWEENTNPAREGGPSLIYTPLTAGSLFDLLHDQRRCRSRFVRAGNFYRSFLNYNGGMIPLADERTNTHGGPSVYGLALHSLTPKGRGHIVRLIEDLDIKAQSPEMLAVLYYELGLMHTGRCEAPEYETRRSSRISLPLGVVRASGWTAGISALRALNRVRQPLSDYALDQQNLVYLSHEKCGVILTGHKSKNDSGFSTFCRGLDAYPIDTGTLSLGRTKAETRLSYATFDATLTWELSKTARLTLKTDDSREITTTLPITNPKYVRCAAPFKVVKLKGFSPYAVGNAEKPVTAVRFVWTKQLSIEFSPVGK